MLEPTSISPAAPIPPLDTPAQLKFDTLLSSSDLGDHLLLRCRALQRRRSLSRLHLAVVQVAPNSDDEHDGAGDDGAEDATAHAFFFRW